MKSLGVPNILRDHIPGGGFDAHGFRAIVATDVLTCDPGNYSLAAQMLNDDPATVRWAYGKQKQSDNVRGYLSRFEQMCSEQENLNKLRAAVAELRASGTAVSIDDPLRTVLKKAEELCLPISAVFKALQ